MGRDSHRAAFIWGIPPGISRGEHAWRDFMACGGMPLILSMPPRADRGRYLKDLFYGTYLADVSDRYGIRDGGRALEALLIILSTGAGKRTNPARLSGLIQSGKRAAASRASAAR